MTTEVQEIGFGYVKTLPGILKIAEEVVNFIGLICIAATGTIPKGDAFLACSIIALVVTGVLLLCYVAQIVAKLQISWYRIEFFYCVVIAVFYLIVSSLVVTIKVSGYIAGGVFGFIATVLYAADAYHKFRMVAIA